MKTHFIIILLIFTGLYAQEVRNPLNPEIIKTIKPSQTALNKIIEIDSTINEINKNNSILSDKYLQKHNDFKDFKYDNSKIINYVKNVLDKYNDRFVQEYAVFRLFNTLTLSLCKEDTTFAEKCVDFLHPDNILFSLDHNAILIYTITKTNLAHYAYLRKNKLNLNSSEKISETELIKISELNNSILTGTLDEFYRSNPDRGVKAASLIYIICSPQQDENVKNKYYKILNKDFSDLKEAKSALIKYSPNSKMRVGNEVPYFKEKLLGNDGYISPDKLKGKYYLICFWATWCGNCIIEMKELKDVYEKYKNKNFTILYVSIDDNDKVVKKFINERIKMPWYLIRLRNWKNNKMWKEFGNDESGAIPKNYFINPGGIILENDYSWSSGIEEMVSHYINN